MPITSWTPQNVYKPVLGGFRPAVFQTLQLARAMAPGSRTKRAVRVKFVGPVSATLDALRRGPPIYPILSGSKAGPRESSGWFVVQRSDPSKIVKTIEHPGTPPHPFLTRAVAGFPSLYAANVRRRWH